MSQPRDAGIVIRPLKTWDEFLAAEELQRIVWKMSDWRDAVPGNLLIAAQKNGGLSLGAFDGDALVGFTFSFLARETARGMNQLKHHSHMLAVLPEYQARKIGARLKWAQREHVLAQGIDLITWTYDPLLALNARLNLVHLGAIACQYLPNAYGEMTDGLNAGLTSDRFQVEWWLNAPRVCARQDAPPPRTDWRDALHHAQLVFDLAFDENNLPRIAHVNDLRDETLLVEIPADLAAVKAFALDLAREWRTHTRQVLQDAFAGDWVATDFVTSREGARAAYVLTRAHRDPQDL
ncbi:MAG: hypothetical protein HY868_13185 [Chloroflexi bacterium]|nr:hypothetical protein [Chloroflexota bacterium]